MSCFDLLAREHAIGGIPENVFADIRLDQLLAKYLGEKAAESILAVIGRPLSAVGIRLRQELFLELEKAEVTGYFTRLKRMVQDLELKYNTYHYQENQYYKSTAFLALVEQYIAFVEAICDSQIEETAAAALLRGFIASFAAVKASPEFVRLKNESEQIRQALRSIGTVHVDVHTPDGVPVSAAVSLKKQAHLAGELLEIAEKYSSVRRPRRAAGRRELSVSFLIGLAQLYPELFAELEQFHEKYQGFIDSRLFAYRSQFAFYLDLKSFYTTLGKEGIPLCLPKISSVKRTIVKDAYDIALLLKETAGIVPNDIEFDADQGFYLLTGANSGGKTAYLRAAAVCHILFSAGGWIPAVDAQVYPFRQIFTQFPADESTLTAGRLEDEQRRIDAILAEADEETLVLLNETFSSTSEELSLELSFSLVANLCRAGVYGLFVTHHHKLADQVQGLEGKTKVGFLTAVVLDDAAHTRTYKIRPQRASVQSYARTILEKYGLTRSQLAKRLLEVK